MGKPWALPKPEDLGTLSQTLLRGLLKEKSPKNLQDLNPIEFMSLTLYCTDSSVAVFRVAISGCSASNPVQRDWHGGNLLPRLISATG